MIITLIGEQWRPSIIYLQLLCFVGMFYPLHAINLNIMNVIGRSDLFLRLEIFKKTLAVPVITLGILLGIKEMIIGMIAHSIIAFFLNSYWSGKFIGYSTWQQLRDIIPSFFVGSFIGFMVFFSGNLLKFSYFIELIIQLVIGGLLTIGIAEIFQLESYS
ncbi:MAG: polysaccharide biosynthesis C-terminal domain-containing protein, partial [Proteobacteria bacterium]|nr:polysaccharide biosynthesis C-terminal domain-containing protein [Pseudomonadota bacterium]